MDDPLSSPNRPENPHIESIRQRQLQQRDDSGAAKANGVTRVARSVAPLPPSSPSGPSAPYQSRTSAAIPFRQEQPMTNSSSASPSSSDGDRQRTGEALPRGSSEATGSKAMANPPVAEGDDGLLRPSPKPQRLLSPSRASQLRGQGSPTPSADPSTRSFKRRAPSGTRAGLRRSSRAPSAAGTTGPHASSSQISNFIHKASFGAMGQPRPISFSPARFPPPRQSFAAGSQIGSDAVARWRNMRRVHTLSVHPPTSGDPEDPSSWSFPEAKPQIPTLLPSSDAPPANPIPLVPFAVLCLVCFGEFSSAGVAGPFLFFMVESFDVGTEADVGFWAGIVASVFFFAQFLTSLLWSSIADKYGRRAVLLASLCGNAVTLVIFGTSTNLRTAITVRLAQGLFNGAVGVAKGAIRDLTDSTNEGRAYAILGFAWGFGGILGPILGGVLEHPAQKFPGIFGHIEIFETYPYLLPCLAGASFTTIGAILSLFVGPDGGPRQGKVKLDGDDNQLTAAEGGRTGIVAAAEEMGNNLDSLGRSVGKKVSGYFNNAKNDQAQTADQGQAASSSEISLTQTQLGQQKASSSSGVPRTFTQQVDEETGGPPSAHSSDDEGTVVTARRYSRLGAQPWRYSKTEERRLGVLGGGSAYGYEPGTSAQTGRAGAVGSRFSVLSGGGGGGGSGYQQAPASSFARPSRGRATLRQQRQQQQQQQRVTSAMGSAFNYAPDFEAVGADPSLAPAPRLNFAQRFFLANDDAVLSISDLWVAAAINADDAYAYDDVEYLYDDEDNFLEEGDGEEDASLANESQVFEDSSSADEANTPVQGEDYDEDAFATEDSTGDNAAGPSLAEAGGRVARPHLPPMGFAQRRTSRTGMSSSAYGRPRSQRLGSYSGRVPSLYANVGLEVPRNWGEGFESRSPYSPALRSPHAQPGAGGSFFGNTTSAAAASSGSQQQESNRTSMQASHDRFGQLSPYERPLAGIPESHSGVNALSRADEAAPGEPLTSADIAAAGRDRPDTIVMVSEKPPSSVWSMLPLTIIAHYCLLAFHSALYDQVFMAFLVTPYASGGLGLTAAHYAELIAAMAFLQIGSQFYFYPKVGPPHGRLSHLQMLRLGTAMHGVAYTLFPLLRNFTSGPPDDIGDPSTAKGQGDLLVMLFMIIFASGRFLANTCGFTAASIMMNALTPPHLVPLANGLAQTTSSAARFIGPVVAGVIWQKVGKEGFWIVSAVALIGCAHASFGLKAASA